MKCEQLQEVLSGRSKSHPSLPKTYLTEQCPHAAKYKVTYLKGTDGKKKTKLLCGKHFVALKRNSETALKRGWDNKLTVTTL